jgi:uncharacterized membrane protein
MKWFLIYLVTFISFLAIDAIWLGLVAPKFYKQHIGHLMAESPNLIAALVFYLIFIVGLVFFVLVPSLESKDIGMLVVRGALFGLITYATYDLTNLATLTDWPITVTIVDMIWGTVLSTSVSLLSYFLIGLFNLA